MSDTIYRGTLRGGLWIPLQEHLSALGSDTVILSSVAALAEAGLLEEIEPESEHRATIRSPNGSGVYAISNKDLGVWGTAAATAAKFAVGGGWAGVAIGGLFGVLVAIWKKHALLPKDQGELLIALKRHPDSTIDELLLHLPDGVEVTAEDAGALLEELKNVRLANGSTVKMADEKDGTWWAVDV